MAGLAAPLAIVLASVVWLEVDERVVRYPVTGTSAEELRAALRSRASEATGGSHGRTRSSIEIEYAPEPVAGGCRAKAPGVAIEITTTLPEWTPAGPVEPRLRKRWEVAAAALQRHEARHREHAMAAARRLRSDLAALGVQPDCRTLRREIDRAFRRATLEAKFRDARYDEQTGNGLAQDVVP